MVSEAAANTVAADPEGADAALDDDAAVLDEGVPVADELEDELLELLPQPTISAAAAIVTAAARLCRFDAAFNGFSSADDDRIWAAY